MLARFAGAVFYTALAVIALTFIFSNRDMVDITLLPFLQKVSAPLYVALAATFIAGLAIGLMYSATLAVSYRRKLRRANRTAAQLEQELAARTAPKPLIAP
jgi:uncharacterized integral membrane protein